MSSVSRAILNVTGGDSAQPSPSLPSPAAAVDDAQASSQNIRASEPLTTAKDTPVKYPSSRVNDSPLPNSAALSSEPTSNASSSPEKIMTTELHCALPDIKNTDVMDGKCQVINRTPLE